MVAQWAHNPKVAGSSPAPATKLKLFKMATAAKRSRQARVLEVLQAQLKSGVKTQKKTTDVKVPLTEHDIKRINKEIEILKAAL